MEAPIEMSERETASPRAIVPSGDVSRMNTFILRKNLFSFLGQKFEVYDPLWVRLLVCRQKAFKLKEDIRVYSDENETKEVLSIKARQIIDFSAAYDVVESATGKKIGAMRRKGWSSFVRDEWTILDDRDREVGKIQEDSLAAALFRRFVFALLPQSYTITLGEQVMGEMKQHFNPFVFKATLDLSPDREQKLPRLLAIGGALLLLAIEGRQK